LHVFSDGSENVKFIGVYSSYEEAESAVARLKSQPGFRDYPEIIDMVKEEEYRSGFTIDSYKLNEDNWREGFITE